MILVFVQIFTFSLFLVEWDPHQKALKVSHRSLLIVFIVFIVLLVDLFLFRGCCC